MSTATVSLELHLSRYQIGIQVSMPRRAAAVTQADIARAIRAAQAAGLPVTRIVVRADGVSVETAPQAPDLDAAGEIREPEFADSEPLVLL